MAEYRRGHQPPPVPGRAHAQSRPPPPAPSQPSRRVSREEQLRLVTDQNTQSNAGGAASSSRRQSRSGAPRPTYAQSDVSSAPSDSSSAATFPAALEMPGGPAPPTKLESALKGSRRESDVPAVQQTPAHARAPSLSSAATSVISDSPFGPRGHLNVARPRLQTRAARHDTATFEAAPSVTSTSTSTSSSSSMLSSDISDLPYGPPGRPKVKAPRESIVMSSDSSIVSSIGRVSTASNSTASQSTSRGPSRRELVTQPTRADHSSIAGDGDGYDVITQHSVDAASNATASFHLPPGGSVEFEVKGRKVRVNANGPPPSSLEQPQLTDRPHNAMSDNSSTSARSTASSVSSHQKAPSVASHSKPPRALPSSSEATSFPPSASRTPSIASSYTALQAAAPPKAPRTLPPSQPPSIAPSSPSLHTAAHSKVPSVASSYAALQTAAPPMASALPKHMLRPGSSRHSNVSSLDSRSQASSTTMLNSDDGSEQDRAYLKKDAERRDAQSRVSGRRSTMTDTHDNRGITPSQSDVASSRSGATSIYGATGPPSATGSHVSEQRSHASDKQPTVTGIHDNGGITPPRTDPSASIAGTHRSRAPVPVFPVELQSQASNKRSAATDASTSDLRYRAGATVPASLSGAPSHVSSNRRSAVPSNAGTMPPRNDASFRSGASVPILSAKAPSQASEKPPSVSNHTGNSPPQDGATFVSSRSAASSQSASTGHLSAASSRSGTTVRPAPPQTAELPPSQAPWPPQEVVHDGQKVRSHPSSSNGQEIPPQPPTGPNVVGVSPPASLRHEPRVVGVSPPQSLATSANPLVVGVSPASSFAPGESYVMPPAPTPPPQGLMPAHQFGLEVGRPQKPANRRGSTSSRRNSDLKATAEGRRRGGASAFMANHLTMQFGTSRATTEWGFERDARRNKVKGLTNQALSLEKKKLKERDEALGMDRKLNIEKLFGPVVLKQDEALLAEKKYRCFMKENDPDAKEGKKHVPHITPPHWRGKTDKEPKIRRQSVLVAPPANNPPEQQPPVVVDAYPRSEVGTAYPRSEVTEEAEWREDSSSSSEGSTEGGGDVQFMPPAFWEGTPSEYVMWRVKQQQRQLDQAKLDNVMQYRVADSASGFTINDSSVGSGSTSEASGSVAGGRMEGV